MANSDVIKSGPNITMMVADYGLSSPIDMRIAFSLFPVFRPGKIEIPKGQKLPHYKIPGAIVTADFKGVTRGIIRRKNSFFKNSVSMDISCIEKNANIKLSSENIHLCGITSESMIEEVTDYIISYIKEIQELLTYAAENPDIRDKTIEWLKDVSMGIAMKRTVSIYNPEKNIIVKRSFKYNYIRAISGREISESPDEKLSKLYLRMLPDIVYHKDFCRLLDWCRPITWVANDDLEKVSPIIHVKNTNSKLRFNVGICFIFAIIFRQNFPMYNVSYDNTMKPSTITITIPYTPTPEKLANSKKEEDDFAHTFMLQSSGSLTHSGPGGEESDKGIAMFIEAMEKMENLIPRDYDEIMEIAEEYL